MDGKILIIDREVDNVKVLKNLLIKNGHQVKTATDSQEAIRILGNELIDLIITEIRMPLLDGINFVRKLKQIDKEVEIIVLTGLGITDNIVQEIQRNGAFAYLTKPLNSFEQLYAIVNQVLERKVLCLNRPLKQLNIE